jgi:hypothetical protein
MNIVLWIVAAGGPRCPVPPSRTSSSCPAYPRKLHPIATLFRTVHGLITAPCGYEGDSFPVRRILKRASSTVIKKRRSHPA